MLVDGSLLGCKPEVLSALTASLEGVPCSFESSFLFSVLTPVASSASLLMASTGCLKTSSSDCLCDKASGPSECPALLCYCASGSS